MIMSLGEIQEKQLWLPGPLPKIVQTALILPVCTSMSGMCRRYYNIFYRIYIYMSYVYIYVCVLHFHRQLYKALLPLDPDSLMFDVETVRSIDSGVTLPGINCALATYWPIIYPKKNNIDTSI